MSDNYDKVSLLLPMNGANNGTDFPDYSPVPKTVTRSGVITVTEESKFYGSSAKFVAASEQTLTIPHSSDVDLAGSDFTLECWIYVTNSAGQRICGKRGSESTSNQSYWFTTGGSKNLQFAWTTTGNSSSGTLFISSSGTVPESQWVHVAGCRSGSTVKVFINGVEGASDTIGTIHSNSVTDLVIGRLGIFISEWFNGYMQDFRLIKGAALYTANFTPPTRLIGTISNADVGAAKILDINGDPAERTVFAVPRSYMGNNAGVARIWSTTSNASGEFEIQAPAGVDHSVVALADEATLYNDIVHRVIPV